MLNAFTHQQIVMALRNQFAPQTSIQILDINRRAVHVRLSRITKYLSNAHQDEF